MDLTTIIITGAVGAVISFISGLALYRSTRNDQKMEAFAQAITTLQNTAVSDSHVRRVFKEELLPFSNSLQELVKSNQRIEVHIAEEKGFKAAQSLSHRVRSTDH